MSTWTKEIQNVILFKYNRISVQSSASQPGPLQLNCTFVYTSMQVFPKAKTVNISGKSLRLKRENNYNYRFLYERMIKPPRSNTENSASAIMSISSQTHNRFIINVHNGTDDALIQL